MDFRKNNPQDKSRPTFHDAAYIIYVSLGLIAWCLAFFQWGSYPLDSDSASSVEQVVGMMTLLWFGLPLLVLLPAALVVSLALSEDRRLLMMLLFTLILLLWVGGSTSQWITNPWPMIAYGTISLVFALYWFFWARWV